MNRRDMLKFFGLGACALAGNTLTARTSAAALPKSLSFWQWEYARALVSALNKIDARPGSQDLAVLTNAGAGEVNENDTLAYLDLIVNITRRSRGTKALFTIQTPVTETIWTGLYNKANGRLAFIKQVDGRLKLQVVDVAYDNIIQPDVWEEMSSGLLGSRGFSIITIALVWQTGAPWRLFRAAELHNHICPGLSMGYILSEYVLKYYPLAKGEQYVFVGAPPFCANDIFQTFFDATMGKKGSFSMIVDKKQLKEKYGANFKTGQFVLRLNPKNETCEGVILEVDDDAVATATGVTLEELSPEGGRKNPLFHISRLRRAVKLAEIPLDIKLGYVRELDRFSGDMSMAKAIMGRDFDPYSFL